MLPIAGRLPLAFRAGALYLVLALVWTLPVWVHPGTRIPDVAWSGYATDAPVLLWGLAWVPFAISHGLLPYYSHWLNAPAGANFAVAGPPVLFDLLLWPVTVWGGVVNAYNALVVLSIVLNALAAFVACRRFVHRSGVAVLAGGVYGFCPFVIGQGLAGHPNLMLVPTIPLVTLLLHELLIRQKALAWRTGLYLGALAAAQLLTSVEVAVTTAIAALGISCAMAVRWHGLVLARWPYVWRVSAWAVAVSAPVTVLVAWADLLSPGVGHGQLINGSIFAPNPLTLLLPGLNAAVTLPALHAFLLQANLEPTEALGTVGLPLAVVLWQLGRRHDMVTHGVIVALVMVLIFMLGASLPLRGTNVGIPLPEAVFAHLPLLGNLLPDRLSALADWLMVLCLAMYSDRLPVWTIRRRPWLLVVLAVLSWLPVVPSPTLNVTTPPYFLGGRIPVGATLLVYPFAQDAVGSISELWQAQSHLRFRLTSGYYLRAPSPAPITQYGPPLTPLTLALDRILWTGRWTAVTPHLRWTTSQYLQAHYVTEVVAGPGAHHAAAVRLLAALLGRAPLAIGGVDVWAIHRPMDGARKMGSSLTGLRSRREVGR